MSISDVNSKVAYLDNLDSIIQEIPDLFQALQTDKFD